MSEKFEKFSKALEKLINDGDMLHLAMEIDCFGQAFVDNVKEKLGEDKVEAYLKKLPDFKGKYQAWYSEAQSVVKQVLPDRLSDFQSYYEYPGSEKKLRSRII